MIVRTIVEREVTEGEITELARIVEGSGLEPTKAQYLIDRFSEYFALAAEWEQKARALVVTDDTQVAEMKMARTGRLFLREKRLDVEAARKQLKEQSLREGRAIDGIANVLKALIIPIEEHLDAQEHFTENRLKREEEARRLEAEKALREKEERERLEREAEERQIRAENERLHKEAEEREAAIRAERAEVEKKAAAERKRAAAKVQAERDASERKLAKERERAAAERDSLMAQAKEAEERARREYEAKLAARPHVTCPQCGQVFAVEGHEVTHE